MISFKPLLIYKKIGCILLLLALILWGGQSLGEEKALASPARGKRYLFWEISSGESKVYLLGSIHLAKESFYPLSSSIEEAFKRSDLLAVEVDLNKIDQFELAAQMLPKAVCYKGIPLKKRLSPRIYRLAKENLEDIDLNIEMFGPYQPWFLAINITSYALIDLGFDPDWGIDQYFIKKAKKAQKSIVELETIDYQLNLFSNLSDDLQELFLLASLSEAGEMEKYMDTLIAAWEKGDKRRLETILMRGLRQYPRLKPFYDRVFFQRNKNMADRIEDYLADSKVYFVVVGAGHLVGSKGIVQLLRKRGYQTRQH